MICLGLHSRGCDLVQKHKNIYAYSLLMLPGCDIDNAFQVTDNFCVWGTWKTCLGPQTGLISPPLELYEVGIVIPTSQARKQKFRVTELAEIVTVVGLWSESTVSAACGTYENKDIWMWSVVIDALDSLTSGELEFWEKLKSRHFRSGLVC